MPKSLPEFFIIFQRNVGSVSDQLYISECKYCSAVTQGEGLGCYRVWALLVVDAGVVSPLSHVQQTSVRHFKKCHMQRRVQTILNKLPEIHKQQLPPLCARHAPQVVKRDLTGTVGLPAVGMATGVPQGFAKAAAWEGPSAWRQMLHFVDGSPGVSVQPRQAVDPQSGEEGL